MRPSETGEPSRDAAAWIWAAVAILGLAITLGIVWQQGWLLRLSNYAEVIEWMRRDDSAGPLVCIGIQFLQVVIFAIPGEITQIAAGYVFGAYWGFVYSIIGILCGTAFDFAFARVVGRPVVSRLIGADRIERIDAKLRSSKSLLAIFGLFLLPGAPKDAMSYVAGLTGLRFPVFLAVSILGRSPALLLSTIFGDEASEGDWRAMALIAAVAVFWFSIGAYYYRSRRSR